MRFLQAISIAFFACEAAARRIPHNVKPNTKNPMARRQPHWTARQEPALIIPKNANTTKYAVNGSAIPEVSWDIGESYAGLMPIGTSNSSLYFWFFPSPNQNATDEITIWLNGGPGCSSLEGFLQENGPFLWQYGTFKPVPNSWSWTKLTNMVWVEQPVGTGFTRGTPTAHSQEEAAAQFLGFLKNFIDTFGLQNKKIFLAGESYAGKYIPYFADAMLKKNNTAYNNVKGIMIYDPSIASDALLEQVPAVPFVDKWAGLFNLNASFSKDIHERNERCGYADYLKENLVFPPKGPLPQPPSARQPGCDLWSDILDAVFLTNPCFDIYAIATTCPLLWDVLGFPGSFDYLPEGATIYFNRTDVQKAINAPVGRWAECSNGVLDPDNSPNVIDSVLPRVIDALDRTMIVHGDLDYILLYQGTLLAIQNMTWGGKQGFQEEPQDCFFVPYHDQPSNLGSLSAAGDMGITRTERKLTWVEQRMSGHMVPQYQPSSAFRQLEFLLGRVSSLGEDAGSFTVSIQ